MCIRPPFGIVPDRYATASLVEELRQLRKLAKDRRAASFDMFRRGKRPSSTRPAKSVRGRKALAA